MATQRSENKPRVLVVSGVKGDTRRYRAFHLHQQFRLAGIESDLSHVTDPRLPHLAEQASILILHRAIFNPFISRLIGKVRSNHGLVLADVDDLIFEPSAFQWIDSPDFQDPIRAALYREEMDLQRRTLAACDGVLTSTEYLAERVRALGRPAWVHPNAASLELEVQSAEARLRRQPHDAKIWIGYASGTPTHNRDFEQVAPVLMEFMAAHPQVNLNIIGYLDLERKWDQFQPRLIRENPVPWRQLPYWLAQLDINLAPLAADNPFSQSKSEIKYLEASLVDVPTLASRAGSYASAIRSGENGLLASTDSEWRNQLECLLDPDYRSQLAHRALQDAADRYSPRIRAHQLVDLLNEISHTCQFPYTWDNNFNGTGEGREFWWPERLEFRPTEIEMGLYTLRTRGLRTLLKQVWIYFRRAVARYIPY